MKLMIASDVHGALPKAEQLICLAKKTEAEALLLLGDLYYHGPNNSLPQGYDPKGVAALLNSVEIPVQSARGNCDAEVDQSISTFPFSASVQLCIGDLKILAAHGHRETDVSGFDVVLSGHTHLYQIKRKDGILFVNVGSVGIPRGGHPSTCAILTEDRIDVVTLDGVSVASEKLK